ncbi:MAG: DGQHR domain-containing protein [Verrucomicrobiota bacterium JB024]|nr:DGQHR domain-containing protein [Verrucomicrobiota bacterium JB024]
MSDVASLNSDKRIILQRLLDMETAEWVRRIINDASRLKRDATKWRKPYQEKSVLKSEVESLLKAGWTVDRELKIKTKLQRPWSHAETLKNKVWYLLFLLGYPEIGDRENIEVKLNPKEGGAYWKPVDAFAKDDETVVVATCVSSARIVKKSLHRDIGDFSAIKGLIANSIKKHYGDGFKPKIIWIMFTHNIAILSQDRELANSSNINIVTEKELRYYIQIADHLRSAARFQFHAEFLKGQKIHEMENVRVPAVKGRVGGRTFYSFVSTPKQMLKITFVNHRSLNDPAGAPTYQRLVSRTRLRQISNFILGGGYFPSNILINFSTRCRFEKIANDDENNVTFGNLYLPSKYRSAWIIDGQHRLYGYAPLSDKYMNQNIMVVAFECLDKINEANLFVTINHEQKPVPKTLLDDLEGELKWGSDKPSERVGAIAARLIGVLNNDIAEPLYGRVTQQGIVPTEKTCLTVPALKDGLRRSGLIGEVTLRGEEYIKGPLCGNDDSATLERARFVLNNYFQLLVSANSHQWSIGRGGYLCTNVSVQGYLLLLGELIKYAEANKGIVSLDLEPADLLSEVEDYIDPVLKWIGGAGPSKMQGKFKVQFGSGGPKEYFYRLCEIVRGEFSDFLPEGMTEWVDEQSEERILDADRKLKELNIQVQKAIFDTFKDVYGDMYWDKGVTDKDIRVSAYSKSQDESSEKRLPLENYLDFIEYKKIVSNKQNWPLLKDVFDIPLPGDKGTSKNVRWMDRINELRRIPAHATESRGYKVVDFEFIDFIYEEFMKRIK